MTSKFFIVILVVLSNSLYGQPWMPVDHEGAVKYTDALKNYQQYLSQSESDEPEDHGDNGRDEDGRDLFARWNWYWQQHLDKDGYMVSPVKNLVEWQKYMRLHNHTAARTTSASSDWIFQGPDTCGGPAYSGLGRVNAIAFDPVDSNTFYAGSAGGGTWKTTDGGVTWSPLYDFLPSLGVADIKVNPLNRNTIFVATGDGDANDAYSSGVIVSYDRGAHWDTTGLTWGPTSHNFAKSLAINPIDTSCMLLASSAGMFKTNDGGHTWINVNSRIFKQVLYNPGDTSIVYAASEYGSLISQVYRSIDGGLTWSAVTSFSSVYRISLAVCPANPALVLAMTSNNPGGMEGIYKSTDNGATFTTLVSDATCHTNLLGWEVLLPTGYCSGQAGYDMCIAIDPSNPSQITVGGASTAYSADGGTSWAFCGYETHTDKHCLAYNPLTGALFVASDGGIGKSVGAPTNPWINLSNGLHITEFYRAAVNNDVTFCLGGAQDNGTKKLTGGGGFTDLTCCDAMQPLINYGDPNHIWYTTNQYGRINMTRDAGATFNVITASLTGGGGWITPYLLHPSDTQTLLLGYKRIFVSHNNGTSWDTLSPVFDPYNFIDRIAIANSNPNYIYEMNFSGSHAATVIHYTTDFGVTWDTIGTPFRSFLSDIAVDPQNERKIWITSSTYGMAKVWSYDLTSGVWTDETGSLPDLPVGCILIDSSTKTKYIGTDAAIFYRDTSMTDWSLYNNHLPDVRVTDLQINYTTGELWAATFGRGMWKSLKADLTSLGQTALAESEKMIISPNPSHNSFKVEIPDKSIQAPVVSVKLVTANGKKVWESKCRVNNGSIEVNTENIVPGFYICEVNTGTLLLKSKVVLY